MKNFDIMGHVKVALFPNLYFIQNNKGKSAYFFCEGGKNQQFRKGSEIPIRRLYYKYPEDFDVITYSDDSMLLMVRNGVFQGIGDITKDRDSEIPAFDIYGNRLIAKNANDLKVIKIEYEKYKENLLDIEKFVNLWVDVDGEENIHCQLGRFLEIFRTLYFRDDPGLDKFISKFRDFLESIDYKQEIQNYKNWLSSEELISFKDIDKIIDIVMQKETA